MERLQKDGWLTGFQLKLIGLILMVFDHIHQMFYMYGAPLWFTMLGRPVAPIFLYLSAEGFTHTRNKKKYVFRLWVAYVLMAFASTAIQRAFPSEVVLMNSIFGTLCLSTYYMWMVDIVKSGVAQKKYGRSFFGVLGALLPVVLNAVMLVLISTVPGAAIVMLNLIPMPMLVEGGFVWIILGVAFYVLHGQNRWVQLIPLIFFALLSFVSDMGKANNIQWLMIFAVIPIFLYNGNQGKKSKYFFYIFYPAHIYALYLLSFLLAGR